MKKCSKVIYGLMIVNDAHVLCTVSVKIYVTTESETVLSVPAVAVNYY